MIQDSVFSFLYSIFGDVSILESKQHKEVRGKNELAISKHHSSTNEHRLTRVASPNVVQNLSGKWIKDKQASDCMEPVLHLMHVRGIIRHAIKLVKGMNIKQSDSTFTIEVFSIIGWFKVVEKYNMNGQPSSWRRRDLRKGQHTGTLRILCGTSPQVPPQSLLPKLAYSPDSQEQHQKEQDPSNGKIAVDLTWGDPFRGSGCDVYELLDPDKLRVTSTLNVGDQYLVNTAIFHRKK